MKCVHILLFLFPATAKGASNTPNLKKAVKTAEPIFSRRPLFSSLVDLSLTLCTKHFFDLAIRENQNHILNFALACNFVVCW
jgi:hypothetical protein